MARDRVDRMNEGGNAEGRDKKRCAPVAVARAGRVSQTSPA